MSKKKKGLWANCAFLLKFAYRTNRTIFYIKIPQIALNAATPFIPIIFVRLILNEITLGGDWQKVFFYTVMLALSNFIAGILSSVLDALALNQMDITVRKIRNSLGQIIMNMPYSDAEQPQIRDFMQRAQDGTNFSKILDQISTIISSVLTAAGLAAVIITIQPLIFIFIALVVACRMLADRLNLKTWDKWRPRYAPIMRKSHYYTHIMKSVEFSKEIKINSLQDWIFSKADNNMEIYLETSTQHNKEIRRNGIFSTVANILQEGAVYLILAYQVIFNGLPIGDFSMYSTSVSTFSNCISSIVWAAAEIMQIGLFAGDFRYCIEIADKSKKPDGGVIPQRDYRHVKLEFDHVYFKYPNTDRYILKNITFALHEGESLSLVGVNGAGKTTIVKLICRLYEPTEGAIFLNGVNINSYSYNEYIDLIGAVFQDFRLFSFSVKENISFNENPDDEEILECLRRSGLGEKIDSLPKGIHTNINKEFDSNGIEFSGGEGQKLAIARLIYKDALIDILDEPTSALDPIAEAEIYTKFHDITKGKMTIYISHRLSSCQFCDKIAVLDNGEIVQYGNHKELISKEGLYSQMWKMQAQYYVEV
ncbi:MAG TPA: ABC transporter ATP-binding protein/permease [Firmicutes bacterium]|nr:ABC transporter ATP-binding protein/permease [Bacillota bacterium]